LQLDKATSGTNLEASTGTKKSRIELKDYQEFKLDSFEYHILGYTLWVHNVTFN